ncbi:MAG: efflux RND transporter periplasmic adaptor subunit [Bacteroidia bacterium]|nr:efflux RND transporter periplasmic adaptor subunit [Bacteroidia bacterium]
MKSKIIYSLFVIAALSVSSCGNKEEAKTEEANKEVAVKDTAAEEPKNTFIEITNFQFKNAGIELGSVEQKGLSESIKVSGKLDIPPQNYAEVSTYVGAVVKTILAVEGDFVKKGQTVIVLEHPDLIKLQEEYISSKSNISYLEKEYERQKDLNNQKISSGKIFQEAEAKYNTEKARLLSLKNQLEMLSLSTDALDKGNISRTMPLKSPVDGYIGHINVSLGSYAEPNKAVFDVINLDDVHIHLSVFEKDINKVKVGQKVYATIPNQQGNIIEAVIFKIGKMLDDETKAIDVHADIKNKSEGLVPGLFVNAQINIGDKSVGAVPEKAVVRNGKKQYIFIVTNQTCENPNMKSTAKKQPVDMKEPTLADCPKDKDGKHIANGFRMIEVKTGANANGYLEIIPQEELPENSAIVTKGAFSLMSQLKSSETVGCCAPGEPEEKK